MATIQNVELVDDIRRDALLLMKSRPNLSYQDAYRLAQKNLIGELKITEFTSKPFSYEIGESQKEDRGPISYYRKEANDILANIINVDSFDDAQLKSLVVAHKMGVDITKIANNKYRPDQIDYLAILLASGNSIDNYTADFDPKAEYQKVMQNVPKD